MKTKCPICDSELVEEFDPMFGRSKQMVCLECNRAGVVIDWRPLTDKEYDEFLRSRNYESP